MSGKIPRAFIDDLLLRVDIVDLIDSHVPLKKSGNSFTARCPFHTEKSPSFSVNRDKQFYHCFGCGVGGNAISFLMQFGHLDFVEAIEDLAGFIGVEVPKENTQYQQHKHDYRALYATLEKVAVFYAKQLKHPSLGVKASAYLKNRGLGDKVLKEFSLGYATDDWRALSAQFDINLLIDAGMVTVKDNSNRYDRFRGRLVFPIRDKRSRVIGFGGRVLDNTQPKYLNSPETPIFSKRKELYGLFELLKKQSHPKTIVIVEGYMDVLALTQYGIHYAVAVLGTAISKTHLDLLFRFTSQLIFCFDGDTAGQNGAWKAVQESFPCLKDGRQIKIMLLPLEHDPDSFIRDKGVEVFEQRLQNSQVLSDYFMQNIGQNLNLATIEGRSRLISLAKPHLEKMPSGVFRDTMLNKLKQFSPNSTILNTQYNARKSIGKTSNKHTATRSKARHSLARTTIGLLLQHPRLVDIIDQYSLNWEDFDFLGKDMLQEVTRVITQIKPANVAILSEYFRGGEYENAVSVLMNLEFSVPSDGIEAEFSGALTHLLKQANEKTNEKKIGQLLNKEKTEGLSTQEKNQFLDLLLKK